MVRRMNLVLLVKKRIDEMERCIKVSSDHPI